MLPFAALPANYREKIRYSADGCWEWRGARMPAGYGNITIAQRSVHAYRLVYELLAGPIPAGCHLHHTCHRPSCVRPDHLVALTPSEHRAQHKPTGWAAVNAAKTVCLNGHEFDQDDGRGHRRCGKCAVERARKSRERRRLASVPRG